MNLIYGLNDDMNLRASFSQTLARPSFKEASIAQIYDAISDIDFSVITECNDVDIGICLLEDVLMNRYNTHCPIREKIVSYKGLLKPWIDSDLRNKIRKLQQYHVLYKLGKINRAFYNRYRNSVTAEIRNKKAKYMENKFYAARENIRGLDNH